MSKQHVASRKSHLELRLRLGARDLELLDDVGDALEAVAAVRSYLFCVLRTEAEAGLALQ